MNILVTGGTGFIGEYFIPQLLDKNHNVRLLVRNKDKAIKLFGGRCEYFVSDITDTKSLVGCCKDIDIVFHMVAKVGNELPNEKNMREFIKVNVDGTKNIIEEAKRENIQRFIFVSSIAAMGIVNEKPITEKSKCDPYLPYQISKYEAEQIVLKESRENKFPSIIIRPTKVYGIGEHELSYNIIGKLCKKGVIPVIGKGESYNSNVYVTDLVQGLLSTLDKGKFGEIYILTAEDSIAMNKVIKIIGNILNKKVMCVQLPKGIMIILATFIEFFFLLIGKKPLVTKRNILATASDRIYDISKAKEELGYSPQVSMEEGITKVIKWYKEENII